jgi:hypothetical protein
VVTSAAGNVYWRMCKAVIQIAEAGASKSPAADVPGSISAQGHQYSFS